MKNKKIHKKRILIFVLLLAFAIGLASSLFIFNHIKKDRNQNVEVTFTDPHQAVIFWKTDTDTKGYVKYGNTRRKRDKIAEQTSSEFGKVHAVVIDEIPLEGIYVSLHNESDSIFLFSTATLVKFNSETFLE